MKENALEKNIFLLIYLFVSVEFLQRLITLTISFIFALVFNYFKIGNVFLECWMLEFNLLPVKKSATFW